MTAGAAHAMPFGAELRPDGSVRFRLWAPDQRKLSVALEDEGRLLPAAAKGDGWFELVTDAARVGSRYRFELQDGMRVPDPASRFQPEDVHGPSVVVDPRAYSWRNSDWRGRPWHETILYELHVGTFTQEGSYDGIRQRFDHLVDLGVTAIELMPLAEFPGRRNWGYDGVLPFAPDAAYGSPEALKRLVDEAHGRGMMVFLDVVYNHFGPDGNYLSLYASRFFNEQAHTPWGAAIDYRQRAVRDFAIHNALYWLEEYRFDGLRLDAVHAIVDDSQPDILVELAETVRRSIADGRQVHLVLENDDNGARYLRGDPARRYDAQWNDDFHHVAHVVATGERNGYYADYGEDSVAKLGRALAEGFVYQGEPSPYRNGKRRGEVSRDLPATAFVDFLQNHDQIGNRAFGERLTMLAEPAPLEALAAIQLLAPQIPLIFMGEEWGARQPFCFFCDFAGELADAVREGRRREFARFPEFSDPEARQRIPDPLAEDTFRLSRLDWEDPGRPEHRARLALYRELLRLRRDRLVPRLADLPGGAAWYRRVGEGGLMVQWSFSGGATLSLLANLASQPAEAPVAPPPGRLLWSSETGKDGTMPAWFVGWYLAEAA